MRQTNLVCTPMGAAGRWFGVILSDRSARGPLSDEERYLLWTLGKTAALATLARVATVQGARARQLQERIDLAREVHEGVIQRLFGVQLVFSSNAELAPAARERIAAELQAALVDLRRALQRPLGRSAPETQTTLIEEVERLRREHPDLHLTLRRGSDRVRDAVLARAARAVGARRGRPQRAQARPAQPGRGQPRGARRRRCSSTSATTASPAARSRPGWASSWPRSKRFRPAASSSSASASPAPGASGWRCRCDDARPQPGAARGARRGRRAPPAGARRRRPRGRPLGAAADARRAAVGRALPERAQHGGGDGADAPLRAARRARRPVRRARSPARSCASACARRSRRRAC